MQYGTRRKSHGWLSLFAFNVLYFIKNVCAKISLGGYCEVLSIGEGF